ncbi:hypothetical protein [Thermoactinomyces sp. CICC 10521]|uniref:hypothetical protein n=1 Tax=Thermoactinomyces sp. CICC 10521 TaxID=2767426 RepID=UPI0018DBB689|nr:hypothetical protein [Thermoactinomyces sp. CICC 10521]MBH8608938.1 hypothetical protein [Thermoactinomyces sp. CICC 10521]
MGWWGSSDDDNKKEEKKEYEWECTNYFCSYTKTTSNDWYTPTCKYCNVPMRLK